VLLSARVIVPPFWVEGLTTPVRPALYAPDPADDDPPELLVLLLLHALITTAAITPSAVTANVLRLFML
jgi:hypothetical protein